MSGTPGCWNEHASIPLVSRIVAAIVADQGCEALWPDFPIVTNMPPSRTRRRRADYEGL